LRIFPLYYTVILVFAVFYWVVDSRSAYGRHYLHELPYYLTYTANLVPVSFAIVWSLAAEEQFYLLWPSVERYLARFTIPVLAAAIAINQVVNFPAGRNFISNIVGGANWTQLSIAQTTFTPILLGVGAAHLLHSERGYQLLRFMMLSRWASTIYLISLIGLLIIAPVNISGLPRLCMQLVMAALLVSCVYREDHILRSLFRFYPVRRIGQISYGMYLFHIEIIVLVMHFLHIEAQNGSIRLFFIALVFTVIAAEASFRFFETPFLRIKRNFSVVHQAHV
jgi:peptidoglycan/LPS O-acetylase OafA/YrhL